jgi:hypothetical protein
MITKRSLEPAAKKLQSKHERKIARSKKEGNWHITGPGLYYAIELIKTQIKELKIN